MIFAWCNFKFLFLFQSRLIYWTNYLITWNQYFNNCHLQSHSVNKVAPITSKEIINRSSFYDWNCYFSARGKCLQKYSVNIFFSVFELYFFKKQKIKKELPLLHIVLPLNLLVWDAFFMFVGLVLVLFFFSFWDCEKQLQKSMEPQPKKKKIDWLTCF